MYEKRPTKGISWIDPHISFSFRFLKILIRRFMGQIILAIKAFCCNAPSTDFFHIKTACPGNAQTYLTWLSTVSVSYRDTLATPVSNCPLDSFAFGKTATPLHIKTDKVAVFFCFPIHIHPPRSKNRSQAEKVIAIFATFSVKMGMSESCNLWAEIRWNFWPISPSSLYIFPLICFYNFVPLLPQKRKHPISSLSR